METLGPYREMPLWVERRAEEGVRAAFRWERHLLRLRGTHEHVNVKLRLMEPILENDDNHYSGQ